jgi:hypothetical protein
MKKLSLFIAIGALIGTVAPALAEPVPVAARDLDRYIGSTVWGAADADLGIVAAANRDMGTIAVVGPGGELATIDESMLMHDGDRLSAPEVTGADIAQMSYSGKSNVPIVRHGQVLIEELSLD